jgi:hypothetical protein
MKKNSLALLRDLKSADQDFEWYPTDEKQIEVIIDDIKSLRVNFDFNNRMSEAVKVLDIGAGDGRILNSIESAFSEDEYFKIESYAIEKASIHTSTYRKKGITLLGTDFNQVNFISKSCTIGITNPPYSQFSVWLQTLIKHLSFGVLYAIIPKRWMDDEGIKDAMNLRGVKYSKVLAESDFLDADRVARAKVNIVRFSFESLTPEDSSEDEITNRRRRRHYKPTIGIDSTDPFQLFLEQELSLKKTYSQTTNKFNEYNERERVKKEMSTEGSNCYELIKSKGVLWMLLDNYEIDLAKTLEQYKLISTIDPELLQELGVCYDALRSGAKEKMFGYRNVYWSLLFDKLDAISSRLTSKYRSQLLNKLAANSLDFTYTNALYIISYAVDFGNDLIEQSLISVFTGLTSPKSISRYYVSNEHLYKDDWRYNNSDNDKAKYLLDYRFIHTSSQNFYTESYKNGINDTARAFTSDLTVMFNLLGYTNIYLTTPYENMCPGDKLSIIGTDPEGDILELVAIRYYLNGNKHLLFNSSAMLRLNMTASRLLGWVRSKEDFIAEADIIEPVADNIWEISNNMKVTPNNIIMLTNQAA